MKKLMGGLVAVASLMMLAGCVSIVTSKKAAPNEAGFHYFLPQPVIQMTPKKDGTMEVEVVYWRDTNNEYSVLADSYLGKYTLDLNVDERGFLGTVNFNADSSGIAKQALDSATELRVAKINAAKDRAKTAAADAKAKDEKQASAVVAADAAVKKAQLDLAIAQNKVGLLMDAKAAAVPPTDINAQILAAELDVGEKQVNLTYAVSAQAQFATSVANTVSNTNANGPDDVLKAKAKSGPQAPEPSFLLVEMTAASVSLKPAFTQSDRETWSPPVPPKEAAELTVRVTSPVARLKSGRGAVAMVTANQPLRQVTLSGANVPAGVPQPLIALQADNSTINIYMSDKTPRGDYLIQLDVVTEANAADVDAINAKAEPDKEGNIIRTDPKPVLRSAKVRVE